jgi:hypothetical protein
MDSRQRSDGAHLIAVYAEILTMARSTPDRPRDPNSSSSSENVDGGASPPSPLTRYWIQGSGIFHGTASSGYINVELIPTPEGEWVKFADVASLITERDSARVELQRLQTDLLRGETRSKDEEDAEMFRKGYVAGQAAGAAEGVSRLDTEALAKQIAHDLFVNGQGQCAQRLVLTIDGPPTRNLGGWSEEAMADRIEDLLDAALRTRASSESPGADMTPLTWQPIETAKPE